jgi:hypothetical protein
MAESFLKALKWYIMALAGIFGASAFLMANRGGSVLPWIFVVFGFGIVYIMSYFWREFRGKILVISALVFIGLTYISTYSAVTLLVFTDLDFTGYSQYFMWGLTMLLGVPIMTLAFRYISENQ